MALITINGVSIPTPSEMTVGIMDVSKAERNSNGLMLMERITTKRKLEFNWSFLTSGQLSSLLTLVVPVFFSVTYPDPQLGSNRTGTFYVGDRNLGVLDYYSEVPRYKDVAFNFIER
jgi:hypothetical protein